MDVWRSDFVFAKPMINNDVTLPESVVGQFGEFEWVEISVEGTSIVLTPVKVGVPPAVRAELEALGIAEGGFDAAAACARDRRTRR